MWSFSKLSAHIFTEDGNFRHRHVQFIWLSGRRHLGTNQRQPEAVISPDGYGQEWLRQRWEKSGRHAVFDTSTKLCGTTYIPRLVISWYIVKLNSLIPVVSSKWDFQFRDPPRNTFSCFRFIFNARLQNTDTSTQVFKFKCELLSSLRCINVGRNLEFICTGISFFLIWDCKRLRYLHAPMIWMIRDTWKVR